MKRNESVLVYSVTGLLLVILVIAVLFGDGKPSGPRSEPPRDEVARRDPALGAGTSLDPVLEDLMRPPTPESPATDAGGDAAGGTPVDAGTEAAADATNGPPNPAPSVPLDTAGGMAAVLKTLGVAALGENERQGDYRRVRVKAGDELGRLVQLWCGADQMQLVLGINEKLAANPNALRPGDWIVVPWLDDQKVIDGYLARSADSMPAPATVAATPKVTPEAADGTWYTIQQGDKLWTIAAAKVTQRRASAYVERIVAANPGLDPARIRVGQKILLPLQPE
jgi:nucleoid-associated protein YgaU